MTALENANQSDSEIIDPRKMYMNDFLSISSYLWVAPNRKLSNISDSKPPTNCELSHNTDKNKEHDGIYVILIFFWLFKFFVLY